MESRAKRSGLHLGPDVFCDERRGLRILVRPTASFIRESVDERRAGVRPREDGRWNAVDGLAVALNGIFYGLLGYVLWQLCQP